MKLSRRGATRTLGRGGGQQGWLAGWSRFKCNRQPSFMPLTGLPSLLSSYFHYHYHRQLGSSEIARRLLSWLAPLSPNASHLATHPSLARIRLGCCFLISPRLTPPIISPHNAGSFLVASGSTTEESWTEH